MIKQLSNMKFTEAQQQAINAESGTLLVSAGAGSGKTSVLTERIIQKILDIDNNITDFLVVTFTRASATDLKNKISRAINLKLSEDINNTHLKRQQILLGRASISTIHSFCLDLIKANFEKLGLPAKFRLTDPNEMSIIKRNLLDDLLDEYYTSGGPDFIETIENFLGARDDENIYGVILKMHNKITSRLGKAQYFDGLDLFDEQIEIMGEITNFDGGGFFATKFGRSMGDLLRDDISGCLREIKRITAQISSVRFEVLDKKYSGTFDNARLFFMRLSEILNLNEDYPYNYDDAYYLCENYANVKVGSNRIDKDDAEALELKEALDKKNKYIKDIISYIQKLFSHDFKDIKRFASNYGKSLVVLKDFIGRFDDNLTAEKMRLKSFEFSDLERFAIKLLVEKIGCNGEIHPTDLARQIKGSYKEIYIDEYQDTNKMQDIIFRAISTENDLSENGNRFMVGDIKQSIYAFRGAKPDIFAGYSKMFGEYETQTPAAAAAPPFKRGQGEEKPKPHKIYLRKNFRSSKNIIDFINYIFARLFSEKLGGIEYTGGEVLESGRIFEESESPDITFAIIEKSREENLSDKDTDTNEDSEVFDSDGFPIEYEIETDDILASVVSTEAEYVALTIKNLLDGGYLKNGDKILARHITVLMRNYTKSDIYADALKKYNIACYTDRSKGFLSSAEIMLVVSMLKTIDNPTRDIDLAAVLKSPVFMFSLDDLIYVKKSNTEIDKIHVKPKGFTDPLYRYVRAYAENFDGIPELQKKCADFIAKLNLWRAKSRILPVDKFIWYLYRQTDIMAKISLESFAAERKANLMLLYEYARKFEETTFKGLYGFLNYLNDVQNGKDDFERAKVISENSDVVKIMSIHKSKGLEFPVCILANTGGLFNRNDYLGNPVMSDEGVYFDLKYSDEIGIEKTPFKKLFAEKIKSDMLSEEARILYVALTRAIERLIITGSIDNIDRYLAKNTELNPSGFSSANNMLKWLTPILLNQDGSNKTDVDFDVDLVDINKLRDMAADANVGNGFIRSANPNDSNDPDSERINAFPTESPDVIKYAEQLRRMYDFEYKRDFLSQVPAKVLVTKLKPGILTEDEYAAQALREIEMSPLPRFLEEETVLTDNNPALAGTAAHLFMQFADFEYAEIFGAQNEAENLLSKGFMTEAQYSRIKFYPIDRFFASDLYAEIKAATRVYRETPFNLKVPVSEFVGRDEKRNEVPYGATSRVPDSGEYILVQGAIDLFFEDKNGRVYVVDFKTDQVHKPDGEQVLIRRHKRQIKYYCKAVSEILDKPVNGAYIYSFALNQAVEVV